MVDFKNISEKNITASTINAEIRAAAEPKIKKWMDTNCRGVKYTLTDLLTIDTNDSVLISDREIKSLPGYIQFGKCDKFVFLNCVKLESLTGSPVHCNEFGCNGCISLKSLKDCPETCNDFYCSGCQITDLTPLPRKLKLLSLGFNSFDELNIIGCPDEIDYVELEYTQFTKVTGLENCKIKSLHMDYNMSLETLNGLPDGLTELSISHCKKLKDIFSQKLKLKKLSMFKSNALHEPTDTVSEPIIETDIIDYDPTQFLMIQNLIKSGYLKVNKMNDF